MRHQDIFDKWNIDPDKYETWYDSKPVIELIDAYMERFQIPSDYALGPKVGIPQQSFSRLRRKSRVGIVPMVRVLDALGIDPKKHLKLLQGNTSNRSKLKTLRTALKDSLLKTFPNPDDWAIMVEHADEFRKLIDNIKKLES